MSSPTSHVGQILLDCLRKNPEHVCQIDAATGESETNASVLKRTISLARCFRQLGLKPGDVLTLNGCHHLDFHIPYYAALMCGLPIAIIDPFYKYEEIKKMFELTRPKISFCQQETYEDTQRAAKELSLDVRIVNFNGEDNMNTFIESFHGDDDNDDDFEVSDFDGDKTYVWLITTSGTTGTQKLAAFSNTCIYKLFKVVLATSQPSPPGTCSLNLSPPHWISAYFNALSMPLMCSTKVQTSAAVTVQHIVHIINKYKPIQTLFSPSTVSLILHHPEPCDLSCFENIIVSGSKVYDDVILELRRRAPKAKVQEMYGQTETCGPVLSGAPEGPLGNCGTTSPLTQVKLVDLDTNEEITEPNKPGEMWAKGFRFDGYYNMPEETAKVLTSDGWIKMGDILYRDESNYYFYVERIKMLIKYRGYHMMPTELEQVIRTLKGVKEVAVTSIPDVECGELPVACVIRQPGATVTADDVRDVVAGTLSDNKRLRGGVIFLDALPMTSTGKVARAKLRELVLTAQTE